jgi:hypothetical protein
VVAMAVATAVDMAVAEVASSATPAAATDI